MKKPVLYNQVWLFLALLCSFSFVACDDDDDEEKNTVETSCYFEAENKKTEFKYAYYYHLMDETCIFFSDINLLHYFKNPSEITEDINFEYAIMGIKTDSEEIPTGNIASMMSEQDSGFYFYKKELKSNLKQYIDKTGVEVGALWYRTPGTQSCSASITKQTDGSYIIDIPELSMKFISDGANESVSDNVIGKFYFQGNIAIEDIVYTIDENSDSSFLQWLKNCSDN